MKRHVSSTRKHKRVWQLQEAKARFSQVIEEAQERGYQTITKNGEPVAVIISKKEYDLITKSKISLLEFFKSAPHPEIDLQIERSKDLPRDIDI